MKTLFESSALLDRGGKPTVRELLSSMVFNPVDGTIRLNNDRLVMQRAAVGVELRRELTRIFGPEETRVFLIRLGFLCGQADARFVRTSWPNLNIGDAFTAGTRLHMFSGVVRVETIHNDFEFRKKRFSGEFLWHDSVEAGEVGRPQQMGVGPVCWTQTGYASGYASEFFDTLIVYKELSCAAEGHKHCRVVGKPAEVWGLQDPDVILFRDRIAGTKGAPVVQPVPVRKPAPDGTPLDDILLAPVRARLDRLAQIPLPVLICGPVGSGRNRAARYLHRAAGGAPQGLRRVAAALQTPETLSALLTAPPRKARQGGNETIVFDGIEEMPGPAQAQLAMMLSGDRTAGMPRIVALSALAPAQLTPAQLRPEVWFALSPLPVILPALDDRPDMRVPLAIALLASVSAQLGLPPASLSPDAQAIIAKTPWPGNLPQMRAVLTAAVVARGDDAVITAADLVPPVVPAAQDPMPRGTGFDDWFNAAMDQGGIAMEALERRIYDAAVARSGGNLSAAARLLGLTRPQLAYRIKAAP